MKPRIPKIVGVSANTGKAEARDCLRELLEVLRRQQVEILLESETAALVGPRELGRSLRDIGASAEILVVLGGDGTILRVARELAGAEIPVFGINLGSLGFLTGIRSTDMQARVTEILQGHYQISERHLLQATWMRNGQPVETHRALNDAVISRGAFSRIVRLRLCIDDERLTEYVCDGMIFATATGSTAYSLSAGGPIVLPTARSLVVTPICPHALSNRSIVVTENSTVRAQVAMADGELLLTVDGQVQLRLQVGDEIDVRRAPQTVRLVMPAGSSYFEVLRQKLKWSGANV